jgi:hypothetical protein
MSQAELDQAKTIVRDLWSSKYAGIILESDIINSGRGDGSAEQAICVRLLKRAPYPYITNGSQLPVDKPDILDGFINRRKKGPRLVTQDDYTRYYLLDTTERLKEGYLK